MILPGSRLVITSLVVLDSADPASGKSRHPRSATDDWLAEPLAPLDHFQLLVVGDDLDNATLRFLECNTKLLGEFVPVLDIVDEAVAVPVDRPCLVRESHQGRRL